MSNVLIINNTLKVLQNEFFEVKIVPIFDNYTSDIDKILHDFILELDKSNVCSLTIPITLTDNALDFTGLRFAHHVRLTNLIKFRSVPMVIYGSLDFEDILKLTTWANILLTNGTYYVNISEFSFEKIQKFLEAEIMKPKNFSLKNFLERIDIKPPSNYESHHSVDNELSLLRWSEFLKCDDQIPEVKENLSTNLYFKYHKELNPLKKVEDGKRYLIEGRGRILLIDDEAKKGWKDFYSNLLKHNIDNKSIELDSLDIDFKSQTKEDIKAKAITKINEFKPDIVLLDLRLCDSDFSSSVQPNELTGYKILEEIKKINKGIQVIITTASNKAWNYQLTHKAGANGFIIKKGDSDVAEDISNIKKEIEEGLKRATFLKPIYSSLESSIKYWDSYNLPERKNITDVFHDKLWNKKLKLQVIDFLKNSFNTLENENLPEHFTMSILLLYRIIEMINEYFIIESGDYRNKTIQYNFDIDNSNVPKITNNGNIEIPPIGTTLSTKEKIFAIYYKLNGNINKSLFDKINQLTNYRNNVAIHPNKRFKEESLEYLYDSDFQKFNKNLQDYFSAVFEFINSLK